MAALDELEKLGRLDLSKLSDGQVQLAVTILHSVPANRLNPERDNPGKAHKPKWLSRLLQDRPRPIADALARSIEQKLALGIVPVSELYDLANASDHRDIAALACEPLLRSFTAGSGQAVLATLGWLLTAALKNSDGNGNLSG